MSETAQIPVSRWVHFTDLVQRWSAFSGFPLIGALSEVIKFGGVGALTMGYRGVMLIAALVVLINVTFTSRRNLSGLGVGLFVAMWAVLLIRLASDAALDKQPISFGAFYTVTNAVFICFLPGLALLHKVNRESWVKVNRAALYTIMISSILLAAFGWKEMLINWGRAVLSHVNPIAISMVGVTAIILGVLLRASGQLESKRDRFVSVVTVILGMVMLGMGASRGPVVSLVVVLAVMTIAFRRRGEQKIFRQAAMPLLVAGPVVLIGAAQAGSALLTRLGGIGQAAQQGDERTEVWTLATEEVANHPWLGAGLQGRSMPYYSHNSIMDALLAGGVLYGLLYVGLLVYLLVKIWRIIRWGDHVYGTAAYLLLATIFGSMFSSFLITNVVFWQLSCMVIALASLSPTYVPRTAAGSTSLAPSAEPR